MTPQPFTADSPEILLQTTYCAPVRAANPRADWLHWTVTTPGAMARRFTADEVATLNNGGTIDTGLARIERLE